MLHLDTRIHFHEVELLGGLVIEKLNRSRIAVFHRLGRPLNAVVPGGPRQREMAYRFGVNLVMYALTGNYKADQVHIPFILERLGQ